jgi:hypothetical protein
MERMAMRMEGLLSVVLQAAGTLSAVTRACIAAMITAKDRKKALLFEKRSKNFRLLDLLRDGGGELRNTRADAAIHGQNDAGDM